ncbi:LOW QUALITY PROTEIN: hypothetical protein QTO34_005532 [Cnephaeus nilssonii]|uniref:Uncharacterized protein n=1 Tax=Cnephaeus nilssonii TaxID=3371016 RepID=A0AA40HNM0_CNENI|nr:LOW QUALITY PROTEIN: hypothetical protein QTO34_005532 [Eptesicus nilssonii]
MVSSTVPLSDPAEPGNQAATFYNCPFPSHSDKDIGEDTMFSCCLPVCRGQASREAVMRVYSDVPAAGSELSPDEGCGPLHGGTRRHRAGPDPGAEGPGAEAAVTKRSTQIKVEQQLVEEDSSRSEGPVSHTTEGQAVLKCVWPPGRLGSPGPLTPQGKPTSIQRPPTSKLLRPNMHMLIFNYYLRRYEPVNDTIWEDLEPKEAEPQAPAQEAEAAPPDAELEAPPPPELSPPPAASPAAAVEPGPAPEETEAPAPLDGEPSLEPMLAPASEEELPVEGPAQGPLVECADPVIRAKRVSHSLFEIVLLFSVFILLFICSPRRNLRGLCCLTVSPGLMGLRPENCRSHGDSALPPVVTVCVSPPGRVSTFIKEPLSYTLHRQLLPEAGASMGSREVLHPAVLGPRFLLGPALAPQLQLERLLEVVKALEVEVPPALHQEEPPLPPGLVLELGEEKRSPRCLHVHLSPKAAPPLRQEPAWAPGRVLHPAVLGPQFPLGPALAPQLHLERLLEVVKALEVGMPPARILSQDGLPV